MRQILSGLVLALLPLAGIARENPSSLSTVKTPKFFIENKGQIRDQYRHPRTDIQYKLSAGNMNVFVGNGKLHYQFSRIDNPEALKALRDIKKANGKMPDTKDIRVSMYRMDVSLVGANHNAQVISGDRQEYTENYYYEGLGENGATAHAFEKITYKDVYPNIDWVLYSKNGQMKHEFIVRPGGNPADIRLKFGGATSLKIGNDGGLTATTPMGTVTENAPYSYEAGTKKTVPSAFSLKGDVLSFQMAPYQGTLVIDPTIGWDYVYGGSAYEEARGVTTDASGNVFMTGASFSSGNIATVGAYQTVNNGGTPNGADAWLIKINSSGTAAWATFYGGTGDDYGTGVACDASGDVVIVGTTFSSGTLNSSGAYQTFNSGGLDGFAAKFTSSTGSRSWGTFVGGAGDDIFLNLAVNSSGVYLAGRTETQTGLTTGGVQQQTFGGGTEDGYIVKLNTAGTARLWGSYYGGAGEDAGTAVAVDASGNVYLTGWTSSTSGIASTTPLAFQVTFGGIYDGFLVKLNSSGVRQWGTYYGYSDDDEPYAIAVEGSANVFIGGATTSALGLGTPSSAQNIYMGAIDGFIAKFNTSGARQWGTYMGGSGEDMVEALAADVSGNICYAGYTASSFDFLVPNAFQALYAGGNDDAMVGKLNSNCVMLWSSYKGDIGEEEYYAIATDPSGNIHLGGQTNSYFGTGGGVVDVMITKITDCVTPTQPTSITGNQTVCSGFVYTYSVPAVTGATSYTWTFPSGWTGTSTTNSISLTADITSGQITVTANNACGASAAQSISVTSGTATASVTPGGPTTFCSGNSVLLSANTGSGLTYQWKLNGGNISGATNSTYTASASGSYTVVVSVGSACNATSSAVVVTVTPGTTATITSAGPTTFCSGGSVVLNANTGAGLTYQWQVNGGNISGANGSSYTATTSGSYAVIVTNTGNCSATSSAVTVTVNTTPVAIITPSGPTTFCSGTNVTLNATTGTGYTYQWQLNGSNITGANGSSYTASSGGSYTVIVSGGATCSATSSAVVVTVNPAPTATITPGGPTTFCTGGNVLLNANTGTGLTYQWQLNGSNISGANGSSYTASTAGSYTVIVTNAGNCSVTSSAVSVVINATPTATATAAGATTFCQGGNVLINANTGTGLSYQWQLNGSAITGANGTGYTATATGNYTVIVTSNGCQATSNTVTVSVTPAPANLTASSNSPVCVGDPINLTSSSSSTGVAYSWTGPSSYVSNVQNPTINPAALTNAGTYTVTAIANGCSATATTTVVVSSGAPAQPGAISGNTTVCSGASQVYSVGTVTGAASYNWTLPAGWVVTAGANTNSITVTPSTNSGTINVSASNGCGTSAQQSLSVTSQAAPSATITPAGPTTFCVGGSVTLNANTGGSLTYVWQLNGSNIPGATNASYTAAAAGDYTVIVSNGTCPATSVPQTVTVNPAPAATATAAGPTTFCDGGSVLLNATTGTGFTYQWQQSGTNLSGATNSSYTVATSGSFTVIVDNGSCSATSSAVVVTVNPWPTPSITQAGNVLSVSASFVTYQWFRNGTAITGATNQNYTATQTGNYYVVVTDANTCSGQSNTLNVTSVGVASVANAGFEAGLYPNPNNGLFTVEGSVKAGNGRITMEVVDMTGRVLFAEELPVLNGKIRKEVRMTDYASGMYLLKIRSGGETGVISFMKD